METSDSEYFESADELISDDEQDVKSINVNTAKLKLQENIVVSKTQEDIGADMHNVKTTIEVSNPINADNVEQSPDSNANPITNPETRCSLDKSTSVNRKENSSSIDKEMRTETTSNSKLVHINDYNVKEVNILTNVKKTPDSNANSTSDKQTDSTDNVITTSNVKHKTHPIKVEETQVNVISKCENKKNLGKCKSVSKEEDIEPCRNPTSNIDADNKPVEKCDRKEIPPSANMWEEDEWDDWQEDDVNTKDDVNTTDDVNTKDDDNMWSNDEWNDINTPTKIKSEDNISQLHATNTKHIQMNDNSGWDDEWEPLEEDAPFKNKPQRPTADSWSSWGNWGISSVLSTATSFTSHVTQGISSAIETSIGVPNPEDLARIHKEKGTHLNDGNEEDLKEAKVKELTGTAQEDNKSNISLGFGLGNLVSGVTQITKLVEQTGSKVITGGLDTLETIGKKTVEILQENDPGLKNKTAFLKMEQNKPILSQILREAKEKAEEENKIIEEKCYMKKANYELLFDDHQGLVHLEALEMLSKQCNIKLENISHTYTGDQLAEIEETMEQVKELCELPEDDEDDNISITEVEIKLNNAVEEMNIKITYDKLMSTWKEAEEWLDKINFNVCNENDIHQQAIETLAQLTAIAVEQYHKAGELLLIKEHRSTADEADSLVQLTITLTSFVHVVSTRFTEKLGCILREMSKKKECVDSLITNVFFEAANSCSYIKDAFTLLIPVLLIGAV